MSEPPFFKAPAAGRQTHRSVTGFRRRLPRAADAAGAWLTGTYREPRRGCRKQPGAAPPGSGRTTKRRARSARRVLGCEGERRPAEKVIRTPAASRGRCWGLPGDLFRFHVPDGREPGAVCERSGCYTSLRSRCLPATFIDADTLEVPVPWCRAMRWRGVRGATFVDADTPQAILAGTRELPAAIARANGSAAADSASAFFTSTPDLRSAFPALTARPRLLGRRPHPRQEVTVKRSTSPLPRAQLPQLLIAFPTSAVPPCRIPHRMDR